MARVDTYDDLLDGLPDGWTTAEVAVTLREVPEHLTQLAADQLAHFRMLAGAQRQAGGRWHFRVASTLDGGGVETLQARRGLVALERVSMLDEINVVGVSGGRAETLPPDKRIPVI